MDRSIRCLLAWMPEGEALNTLLGHLAVPGENTQAQRETWETARKANNARPAFQAPAAVLEDLPEELRERGAAFSQRPDVIGAFQSMDWKVGMADLSRVLSYQKVVVEEHAMERVDAAIQANELQSIFSFCLPDPVGPEALQGAMADQKGITFSSLNPNLRVAGLAGSQIDVAIAPGQATTKQQFIGFVINFGAPFVQVAEYSGRWFVRDGYHRCFGLLRRGITKIPCVFVRARSFAELGAANPAFFPYEVLFSERGSRRPRSLNEARGWGWPAAASPFRAAVPARPYGTWFHFSGLSRGPEGPLLHVTSRSRVAACNAATLHRHLPTPAISSRRAIPPIIPWKSGPLGPRQAPTNRTGL